MSSGHTFIKSGYARAEHDNYPSTPEVVAPLLAHIFFEPGRIWEPAAGSGSIVDQLHRAGHEVYASDIVDRNHPDVHAGIDFLKTTRIPDGVTSIITNPPYGRLAPAFIRHALDLGVPQIAMLLRASFMTAAGPRWELTRQISDVVLMGRLRIRPEGTEDKNENPMGDYAWLVFRSGPPQVAQRWHNPKSTTPSLEN